MHVFSADLSNSNLSNSNLRWDRSTTGKALNMENMAVNVTLWKYDGPFPRWFSYKADAVTWCRLCGYNPKHLVLDENPPELELVHGSVYRKQE